ncbi:HNH endonuclease [Knoellia koreensis]|uniref:Restriction endonuclease n=1 Tax=Knoellia koreensis TaxID=2730921 RepID=A0A849HDA4_9MICO|nr:HNH endonuclease [Knoellia sp. DB2414S]NNM45398.1 restriction endonuclease [Knoellia sp. DB2414S]
MARDALDDERLRREVIAAAVQRRADELGGYLPWTELTDFPLPDGTTVRLVDPGRGGIWNPRDLVATLSILTSPDGPYADRESDGFLTYSYQSGPEGGKNLKLRAAMEHRLPVMRFDKIAKATYQLIYPVFVIGDNPITREFTLALDEQLRLVPGGSQPLSPIEKAYAARLVRQRVHQPAFRARVMLAYEGTCCVCTLKHPELLDAAHITEDGAEGGDPVVTNGLSLCKIHHAAYDRLLLGITPDYEVRINRRLLDEIDGPMLRHGLQEMHRRPLTLPRHQTDRPDPQRLETRFERFAAV